MNKIIHTKKRRGISDVISTLLLLAVTVTGAGTLTYFVNENFLNGQFETIAAQNEHSRFITLSGYDSRDSADLFKITSLDNKLDQKLCGVSCVVNNNKIPANSGTEFILLQIKNDGLNSIFLDNIRLNNSDHHWDSQTSGIILNGLLDDTSGKYPQDGKFSIISLNDYSILQQKSINEIQSGEEVILVVKLGNEEDILLNKNLRVLLNVGDNHLTELQIASGGAI